ncbi:MAG: hypothetical protein CME88_10875 [Hirschia sp.]|nr:hypothetical protein [Hirschia sp.]MBF18870.1 hypothetical protein [Hirschia sp.]
MTSDGGQTSASSSTHTVRRVRRVAAGRRPFVPHGLLPLLGLIGTLLIGIVPFSIGIQNKTERAAQEALAQAGASWAQPDVSGQWVTLRGRPPTAKDGQKALEAVRNSRTQTIFGRLGPETRVIDRFTRTSPSTPATSTPSATPSASISPTPVAPDWIFTLSDGVLRLEGELPDTETRDKVIAAARASIDPPRIVSIDDRLSIANVTAPDFYDETALRGVRTISRCDTGYTRFDSSRFSLSCELSQANVERLETVARAPLTYGELGDIQILPREAVASCERSLSDLLAATRIEFATASALISSNSASLLDQIANAVGSCPGRLRIEGHTDNTGSAALNAELSQNRAEAVRNALVDRGISENRLIAQGFGSSQPIATNSNAAGRARNRRIEIQVVRSSE